MKLRTYQYGHAGSLEGLAIGVARQAPRGIRKEEYSVRGYFDVWLPLLAPSRELFMAYRHGRIPFSVFARRYRAEMKSAEARQAIRLVAAFAGVQPVNLGCFCEEESSCHRSVLKELVLAAASELPGRNPGDGGRGFGSPPCFQGEIET